MVDLRMIRGRRHQRTLAVVVAGGLTGALLLTGLGDARAGTSTSGSVVQSVSSAPLVSVAVSPYRILDTRLGTGTGGAVGPVGADGEIEVQIAGVGPVPANAVGVVLNLTATGATEPGYVSAWPTGEQRPTASVLNLSPGIDMPNMITVALGDGRLSLYNFSGSVHLIGDVAAYLIPDAAPASPGGPPAPPPVPTQHTLQLSGVSWTAQWYDEKVGISYDGCSQPGDYNMMMDLPLPGGAMIDQVKVTHRDPSITQSIEVRLEYVTYKGYEIMGDHEEGSLQGALPAYGDLVLTPEGDNKVAVAADARPYLIAFSHDTGAYSPYDVAVCGVEVTYTMPAPA